jgi:hypothetical protein
MIAAQQAVFVTTRDAANSVRQTLCALCADLDNARGPRPAVVVIDDSEGRIVKGTTRRLLCRMPSNFVYHGPTEQCAFVATLKNAFNSKAFEKCRVFLRRLGSPTRDLGAVRTYGLLLALANPSIQAICWLDDDIVLPSDASWRVSTVERLFRSVQAQQDVIVGGTLRGVPDVSCIEAILLTHGVPESSIIDHKDRLSVSGGFLALSTLWATKFPQFRAYNEDWIWLRSLQANGAKITRADAWAWHVRSQIEHRSPELFATQAFGEVYHTGWVRALEDCGMRYARLPAVLSRAELWREARSDYEEYLEELLRQARLNNGAAHAARRAVDAMRAALRLATPGRLVDTACRDLRKTIRWRELCEQMSNINQAGK